MLAIVNPKLGSFNVTAKGGVVSRTFFDARIAQPFLVLLFLNFLGLVCAIPRYIHFPSFDVPLLLDWLVNMPARMYDGTHPGTIVMNVLWTCFNIMWCWVWPRRSRGRASSAGRRCA